MPFLWPYMLNNRWLPLIVGLGISILSILEWQQLKKQEISNLEYNTLQTAQTIKEQLEIDLNTQIAALKRMSNRWNAQRPTQLIWQIDAAAYVKDMTHFQAISWVDTLSIVRWIVPLNGNEAAVNFNLSTEKRRRQTLETARHSHTLRITKSIDLVQGGKGFIVYVPLFPNNQFDGFISGVYRINNLIENALSEKLRNNYAIILSEDNQPFYRSHSTISPNALIQTHVLNLYNLSWQIQVIPLNQEQFDTFLPELSLIIGGIFSCLFIWIFFTAQRMVWHEKELFQLNQQFQKNQAQLSTILDTVLDGIITINAKGIIQSFNASAQQIFGYAASEVIGQNVKCLMPEPYHSEHDGYLHAHQHTHINKIIGIGRELQGKRKDGSVFPIDLAVNQVEIDGQLLYVGLVRDITQKKEFETALLINEEQFRTLASFAPVGIYETDREGNCLFVNERWCELAGLTAEEAAGQGWTKALHPDDKIAVFEAWQNAVLNKIEFFKEYRFQQPSGHVVWISGRAIALKNEKGQTRGYIGTVADISQLKEAEQSITEQEERIRSLYEITTKPNQSITQQLNDVLAIGCQRLGLSIGMISQISEDDYTVEAVYAPDVDIVSGTKFELGQTYCSIVLKSKQPIAIHHMAKSQWHDHPCYHNFQLETYIGVPLLVNEQPYGTLNFTNPNQRLIPFTQSDIEFVQLIANWISVTIERQQVSQTLATRNDELEKTTIELERSNQELEQFAYIASHDLQEPLRVITNYLQLLDRRFGKSLSEDAKGYINRVINGASRLKTLINDLLSFSRITTQAKPFGVLNMTQILENVKSDLEMAIVESNAKITYDPLPTIKGDETQIKQVFQNLISNGIKFQSNKIPQIHISVTETQTHYQFAVSDNGIGIEPAFYKRIFEIFQRLHTREEYQGTGIGLAICKKIIERHGGNIWVESIPNQGTTFYFSIAKNTTKKL